jgi:hypothetical protein
MTGSLLALVAIGKQDKDLIGNPVFSFFKNVYRHHTHFSMESIPIHFDQSLTFGKKSSVIIPRKADLLHSMILELRLPALGSDISWINCAGHSLIKEVTLEIGGVKIDSHTGEFLEILSEVELPEEKRIGFQKMIAKHEYYNKYSQTGETKLYVPLQFWFCRHIGNSLPLVAMQYHEVKISVTIREFSEAWYSNSGVPDPLMNIEGRLLCDFIFLNSNERRLFAQKEHSYLIDQVQIQDGNGISQNTVSDNIHLDFNHPVKDIFWIYRAENVSLTNDWFNFSKTLNFIETKITPVEPITYCQWKINGHDLMEEKAADYFRLVVPYQRYTRIPSNFIYAHSFSINPSDNIQPSGHLNFSQIDSVVLSLKFADEIPSGNILIYARNYNILNIKEGMAGLLYSS